MALPDDYVAALEQLALALASYRRLTGNDAVLVGGAAVAIYTSGQFQSGDFDVVAGQDQAFDRAMRDQGFIREHRQGFLMIGFYHPDHPGYGFQQVSSRLFDGRADAARLLRIVANAPGEIVLPSIEDMIADRLGQYAAGSPSDRSRLRQAELLFRLADGLDRAYLLQRILDEGGDPALLADHTGSGAGT